MEGDSLWQSRQKDIVNIVEKNIQKAECFVIWHHVRKEKSDWNEKAQKQGVEKIEQDG